MDSLSKDLKPVFAAYLNMARQNAYTTLSHISKLMGVKETVDKENILWEMKVLTKLTKGKSEEKQKIIKLLHKHFPFLKPMTDKEITENNKAVTPDMYYQILQTVFRLLNLLRDQHTHHCLVDPRLTSQQTIDDNKYLIKLLRNSFDGGWRLIKGRFKYTDHDMEFLTGHLRYRKEEIPGEFETHFDNRKKEMVTTPRIRYVERQDFYYKLSTAEGMLSGIGILFFTCLFLHKKYATMFIAQTNLFTRNTSEKEQSIIREIFSAYHPYLPKERIESAQPAFALGLDILNELQKCPDELFQTFGPEDQGKFRELDKFGEPVLLKRYEDRFPHLVMRYIDDRELFSNIRFQVSLGKYRYKFYNKQCIDSSSEDRVRALQKELNGFGRLAEIEEKRKSEEWNKGLLRTSDEVQIDTADSKPYITDHHATYVFNGNRIGMFLFEQKKQCYLPPIEADKAPCKAPTCWMSIYELPALIFHHLLCGDEGKQTEEIIKNCVAKYKRLFEDIQNGTLQPVEKEQYESVIEKQYGLSPNDIPEKLQCYLRGENVDMKKRFNELSDKRLEEMIERTSRQLDKFKEAYKRIGSEDNKIGKKGYVDIRPGRLAQYLVEDFMAFQPMNKEDKNTGKVTGLNYQILQSSLATTADITTLKQLFINANLCESKNPHPFLQEVLKKMEENNVKDIFNFYRFYLEEKRILLRGFLLLGREEDNYRYSFLYPKRKKWAARTDIYYRELAGRYIAEGTSIELPRGLFFKAIKELLTRKYGDNTSIQAALNNPKCNVTYLINEYFKAIEQDTCQDFYHPADGCYLRSYKYFNKVFGEKVRNKEIPEYYTIEQMEIKAKDNESREAYLNGIRKQEDRQKEVTRLKCYLNEYKENEKCIRRYKVQDMLLFLMVKNILLSRLGEIKDAKLQYISPMQETNILSQVIPFSITLPSNKVIQQEQLKLKNYGDFYKFLYDTRVQSLLPQLEETEFEREQLELELDSYDRKRIGVFREVHEFESSVIDKHPQFKEEKHAFRDLVEAHGSISTGVGEELKIIRNAFSHNCYNNCVKLIEKKKIPKIAEEIAEHFGKLVEEKKLPPSV